ncbi:hypothetical protein BC936DRAFT_136636, partial [Jimgerdemannia flammicorona]
MHDEMVPSDIYGFGLIVWEVVTDGKTPYEGLDEETVFQLKMKAATAIDPDRDPLQDVGNLSDDIPEYLNGEGTNEDPYEAFKWFHKAAEAGDTLAQLHLSQQYRDGVGTMTNLGKALTWLDNAALALLYLDLGLYPHADVERDRAEAFRWMSKAAEAGHVPSQHLLGCCYEEGTGTKKDEGLAVRWLCTAAENGDSEAVDRLLGYIYTGVYGSYEDLAKSKRWYEMAAEKGHEDANIKSSVSKSRW